jgi:hypothetical protein
MWGHPAGQDVDVPGRYRGDTMEHRINHSPVRGQRVVAGQHIAQRSQCRRLSNLQIRRQLIIDSRSADAACIG